MKYAFYILLMVLAVAGGVAMGSYAPRTHVDYAPFDQRLPRQLVMVGDEGKIVLYNQAGDGNWYWWSVRASNDMVTDVNYIWPSVVGDVNSALSIYSIAGNEVTLRWGGFSDANGLLPSKTPWNVMFVGADGYPLTEDPNNFTYYQPETAFGLGLDNIAESTYANNYIQVYSLLDFEPNLFNVTIGRGSDDTATGPNNVTIGHGAGDALDEGYENTLGGNYAGRYLIDSNDNTGWGYAVLGGESSTPGTAYTQYVVGIYPNPASNKIAAMVTTNNTIVTSWGTNGYFTYYSAEGSDGPEYTRVIHQLSDGRILLGTDGFRIDAPNGDPNCYIATLIMINADGTLDTTWGHNGFFGQLQGVAWYSNPNAILEDNDGNFHIFGQVAAFGGGYYKLSSAGVFISGLKDTNYSVLYAFNGACWADDAKTRIIAVGTPNQIFNGVGYTSCNVSAIDPATGTRDDTWTGNVSITGTAKYGAEAPTLLSLYSINRMSDDGFVTYENAGSPSYLHKFIADGSAYDTDWGTAGKLQMGIYNINMRSNCVIQDSDTIYMYTLNDASKVRINNVNGATGVVTSYFDTTVSAGSYVSMAKINDSLFLGRTNTPALQVEEWTTAPAYVTGIDVGASSVWWIMPDSSTQLPGDDFHNAAAFGAYALGNLKTGGDSSLGLGTYAGRHNETDPNRFFLDNLDRTDLSGEQTKGMMYGYFADDPNDQWLTLNVGELNLPIGRFDVNDVNVAGTLTLQGQTASRLLATDGSKNVVSTDLVSWVAATADETTVADDGDGTITIGIADPLIVGKGGTGAATLTDHSLLVGSGTDAITPLGAATNGQIPIGSTGADPVLATLTGTANQVNVTNEAGTVTLSAPQDIDPNSSPSFVNLLLTGYVELTELSADPTKPSEGQMIIWLSDGTGFGDDGDVCIATTAFGVTRRAILFDASMGDVWP
jgi:hypothetical protein